ncbi:MAG TPA: hypothetical protein VJZ50_06355 [Candidatus Limnocylindrales bacterium]|nr:hypothetical protein [Candidatus Limnocylindrales bacterium]
MRRLGSFWLLLVVAIVACAAPAATPEPATEAGSRHGDPELEALLPATLGGAALTLESQRGVDLTRESEALDAFLADLGKGIEDFSLASAYSLAGDIKAQVGAWRVAGADPEALMPGYIQAVQASSTTPLTVEELLVAGRAVTRIGVPGELTQGPIYVFVRGDTLLFVETTDPALADEAIAKLPG